MKETLIWIVIFPYMIIFSCIPFVVAYYFMDTEIIKDSLVLSVGVFILACVCGFFCLFFIPRVSRQRFRRVITENNNISELAKMSLLIKVIQFPAFVIYGIIISACLNPFLIVFAIYLIVVLAICVIRSGKIGTKAIILMEQQGYKNDSNLLKILAYLPVLDIAGAYMIYRNITKVNNTEKNNV